MTPCSFFSYLSIFEFICRFSTIGDFVYAFFIKQSFEYVTKSQYNRSHEILTEILNEDDTVKAIGKECVNAALELQQVLKGKERYLARYFQIGVHMSMDSMTTSPVESMNNLVKHGPKSINSNMNLSRSVKTATSAIDDRFDDHHNQLVREMGIINRASQAPTKRDIERKAQYMIDINFDRERQSNVYRQDQKPG